MIHGTIEAALSEGPLAAQRQQVDLIFTSPPFPLNRKKSYGNKTGDDYLHWLSNLAPLLVDLLAPDGSIVVELGNSWEPRQPVMSTLPLRALLAFLSEANLHLCQQFIAHNPARLPGPAQWVTIDRTRVKDSYTNIWWMSPTQRPKADNRQVLVEYSDSMKHLLNRQTYNRGQRPSGHNINGDTFLKNNGGAIPSNVLEFANTRSYDTYRDYCLKYDLPIHPARMSPRIAEFFIKMLTDANDLVVDPFSGSNTTGAVAEELGRRWISVEPTTCSYQDHVAVSPIFRIRIPSLAQHWTPERGVYYTSCRDTAYGSVDRSPHHESVGFRAHASFSERLTIH